MHLFVAVIAALSLLTPPVHYPRPDVLSGGDAHRLRIRANGGEHETRMTPGLPSCE
jgi:hypothetical protein